MVNSQKGISTIVVIVIIALVILAAVVGYMLFSGGSSTPAPVTPTQNESMVPTEAESMDDQVKVIEVSGEDFSFSPPNIVAKKGEIIRIVFTAEDMQHDFVIDELDVRSEVVTAGNTTEVEFTPTEAGSFEYYCSVGNHREMGMVGTLTVTE